MELPEIEVHTATGVLFNITNPVADEIDIWDIGYKLAMNCRFNGAVRDYRFYSVAEHVFWGSYIVSPKAAFAFLLYDAQEAYISDVIRPIKRHDAFFNALEENLEKHIREKFGVLDIDPEIWAEVKAADDYMGYIESQELVHYGYSDGGRPVPPFKPRVTLDTKQFGMTPQRAHELFLLRFDELNAARIVA